MSQNDKSKQNLMISELKDSGLTPETVRAMKCIAGKSAGYAHANCFRIPYFERDGSVRADGFCRWKLWSGRTKYTQRAGSGVALYLPPLIDWEALLRTPDVPLVITEGEKKAASVAQLDVPCVGLGGVDSFNDKRGRLLPDLADFAKGREVFVVFDSDTRENKNVQRALFDLADALSSAGAARVVDAAVIPDEEDDRDKVGIDDYLADHKLAKRKALLLALLAEGQPIGSMRSEVMQLNERWVYADGDRLVYSIDPESPTYGRGYQASSWLRGSGKAEGLTTGKQRRKNSRRTLVADEWLHYAQDANVAEHGEFLPDERPGIVKSRGVRVVNTYNKNARLEPHPKRVTKKQVAPFFELLDKVLLGYSENVREERQWLLDWLAYPLQNLGAKLGSAVFVWGRQGIGKSAVGRVMQRIYEPYHYNAPPGVLTRDFNEFMGQSLWVQFDEIPSENPKSVREKLNLWITEPEIEVNAKGISARGVRNFVQFWFCSNHEGGYPVDASGRVRRILHLHARDALPRAWYRDTWSPFEQGEGPSLLFRYLLDHRISKSFEPFGDAPQTSSLLQAQQSTGHACTAFLHRLVNNWDEMKPADVGDWVSPAQLARLFEDHPDRPARFSSDDIKRAIGVFELPQGTPHFGFPRLCMNGARRAELDDLTTRQLFDLCAKEITPTEKTCAACKQTKPAKSFAPRARTCRACTKAKKLRVVEGGKK